MILSCTAVTTMFRVFIPILLYSSVGANDQAETEPIECDLFMAQSTIPNAGLGIFAGKTYKKSDDVYVGRGDICIPLVDLSTHYNELPYYSRDPKYIDLSKHAYSTFRNYVWLGLYMGMQHQHGESTTGDILSYCPGLDCAVNCHLGLINVAKATPTYIDYFTATKDGNDIDQLLQREVHPGLGAYSPYHIRPPSSKNKSDKGRMHKKTNIIQSIPAGGELFKDYGEHWFESRPQVFGNIPLIRDYVFGEQLIQRMIQMKIVQEAMETNNFLLYDVVFDMYTTIIVETIQPLYDTRTLNALPKNYTNIHSIAQRKHTKSRLNTNDYNRRTYTKIHRNMNNFLNGNDSHHDGDNADVDDDNDNDDADEDEDDEKGIVQRILQNQHKRTIKELRTTGVCIDHIRAEPSTIPHAGHGAFATRNLPKNTVITATPIHIIPYSHELINMYKIISSQIVEQQQNDETNENNHSTYYRILNEIQNQQVLLNYCYGHMNSTLLLCPYGSGINYINHHKTEYNVRVEWVSPDSPLASTFQHDHAAVVNSTVDELFNLYTGRQVNLALQFVAIRDIQKDEELFIDYGIEWERAWDRHVQQFMIENDVEKEDDNYQPYVSSPYWNTMYGNAPLPTIYEQEKQSNHNKTVHDNEPNEPMLFPPNNLQMKCHTMLAAHSIGYGGYKYVWSDENHGIPCRIIDRYYSTIERDVLLPLLQQNGECTVNDDLSDSANACNSNLQRHAEAYATNIIDEVLYTVQLEWDDNTEQQYDGSYKSYDRYSNILWMTRTDVPRSAMKFFDLPYTTDIYRRRTFRHSIHMPDDIFPKQWKNLEQ